MRKVTMSLAVDLPSAPKVASENPVGHWERIDQHTLKWVPDDPVPYGITSVTLEVFGGAEKDAGL